MKCKGCRIATHENNTLTHCQKCVAYYLDDKNWDLVNGGMKVVI